MQGNDNEKKLSGRICLTSAKRVVVKVGSAVLTAADGLDLAAIAELSRQISLLWDEGREVILVSSGAVAAGMRRMGITQKPSVMREKQAVAAVGQGALIRKYEKAFEEHGKTVAQVLLAGYDLSRRVSYLNARNTLSTLLSWKVTPIINENDTVATEELKFGDNDNLSAMMAHLLDADALVILTDLDGLFTADPRTDPNARLVPEMSSTGKKGRQIVCTDSGSAVGTGGMASKVKAAKKATDAGIPVAITNGKKPGTLLGVLSGEMCGTFFPPSEKRMARRQCWLAWAARPKGALVVDGGAEKALVCGKKSLLPVGVKEVIGDFSEGSPVALRTESGKIIAKGLSSFSSADIRRIMGKPSSMIAQILGAQHHGEVIHRDNLVLIDEEKDSDKDLINA